MEAEKIENQVVTRTLAFAFAAWAAVLIVAFLAYRGSDVGRLNDLAGTIGSGAFFGFEGFRDALLGVVIAAVSAASWLGLGTLVFRFIEIEKSENHSHLLELAMKLATGAAAWSLVWFFLGAAGAYRTASAFIAALVGLFLFAISLRGAANVKAESRVPAGAGGVDIFLALLAAVPVVLAFVGSLAPPVAKDTLLYHFAVPKAFITQGSSAFIEGNIASYLALGTEMHAVWAMLLGGAANLRAGEAGAGATLFLFFPVLLIAVFGWARELEVSRRGSLVAVLVTATIPTAFYVAMSSYIDLAISLYVLLAVYVLSRWWNGLRRGWLVLIGIFLGAALAAKLTAVFVFAAFALVILLRARGDRAGAAKPAIYGLAALMLAVLLASPWYLRTWAATGSPVFPFYMSIWKGSAAGWDVERSNLFQAMNSQYGGESKSIVDYIAAPISTAVWAQPERPELFDGVIGTAFLMGLPILVWALRKFDLAVDVRIISGIAAVVFLFWLFSSQQLRYLLPILPMLSIAAVAAAESVSRGRNILQVSIYGGLSTAAAAGILVSAAWFLERSPVRVVLGGESRDSYLSRRLDYYPYYRVLNRETEADAKVWLINMRRDTYNLARPYFSDYIFEDWTLRQMVWESRTVQELKAKAAAIGVRYILARTDGLLDYTKSAIIDDNKPRQVNEAKLKMARELVTDSARIIKADSKFSLVKVN